jgi:hypothetical protein
VTSDRKRERLERLEHLEAIRTLHTAYGRYLDAKDWARFSGLFAQSGEIVARLGTTTGPDAIAELFERTLRDVDPGFHVFANLSIELDGNQARAQSLWFYLCPDENGWPKILQCGRYRDLLVHEDDGWRFQRREAIRDVGFPPYGPGAASR